MWDCLKDNIKRSKSVSSHRWWQFWSKSISIAKNSSINFVWRARKISKHRNINVSLIVSKNTSIGYSATMPWLPDQKSYLRYYRRVSQDIFYFIRLRGMHLHIKKIKESQIMSFKEHNVCIIFATEDIRCNRIDNRFSIYFLVLKFNFFSHKIK